MEVFDKNTTPRLTAAMLGVKDSGEHAKNMIETFARGMYNVQSVTFLLPFLIFAQFDILQSKRLNFGSTYNVTCCMKNVSLPFYQLIF
jgi:hypothetical protein